MAQKGWLKRLSKAAVYKGAALVRETDMWCPLLQSRKQGWVRGHHHHPMAGEARGESSYQNQKRAQLQDRAVRQKLEQRKAVVFPQVWHRGDPGRPLCLAALRNPAGSPLHTPANLPGQTPRAESRVRRAESCFRGKAENILHSWKICKTRPLQEKSKQTFFQCKPGICPITSSSVCRDWLTSPSPLLLMCGSLLAVREKGYNKFWAGGRGHQQKETAKALGKRLLSW